MTRDICTSIEVMRGKSTRSHPLDDSRLCHLTSLIALSACQAEQSGAAPHRARACPWGGDIVTEERAREMPHTVDECHFVTSSPT